MAATLTRAAIYARVSTFDQEPENQLLELRRYGTARGWQTTEYVDRGVSGAKDSRPSLDALVRDAKRRRFDTLVVWRLDRLGRNLRHLILLLEELQVLGVAFVSLSEGIDATTPAGKLQLHILGAIAEFERARIAERVRAGLQPRWTLENRPVVDGAKPATTGVATETVLSTLRRPPNARCESRLLSGLPARLT